MAESNIVTSKPENEIYFAEKDLNFLLQGELPQSQKDQIKFYKENPVIETFIKGLAYAKINLDPNLNHTAEDVKKIADKYFLDFEKSKALAALTQPAFNQALKNYEKILPKLENAFQKESGIKGQGGRWQTDNIQRATGLLNNLSAF